jgi:RNA polymerase sigma-70 factor (ECF subfamily)
LSTDHPILPFSRHMADDRPRPVGLPDGFEQAFDGLFTRAFLVARRILGDATAAEDVAAEATARAYAHWRRIGDQPWREGWIVRVASNLALDATRARARVVADAPSDQVVEDDDVAVRLALAAALKRLPRRQREAVALRYLAGLSEAEVAATLRVSAGSVKTHLHRGVHTLRARLGNDVDLEGVTAGV